MGKIDELTNEASAMQKPVSDIAEREGSGVIAQLIQQYCPEGVEYVKLGDCIKSLNTGLNPRQFFKLNTEDATNYYITIREIQNNTIVVNDKTDRLNDEALRLCNNRSNLEKGDVLFSGTGTIGEVAVIEDTPTNWNIKEGVYAIKPDPIIINYKFLMYLLQSTTIRKDYLKKAEGGTVKSVSMGEMRKLKIPLPPLPVQEAIVNILDRFAVYAAELQAELQARQQQYNYYRDTLLSFEGREDVQWMKLGDVATQWYRGAGIKRDEVSDDGTPCIRYGEIHTTYNIWFDECVSHTDEDGQPTKKYADHGDILFAITSEDIPFIGNSVAYLGKERIMVGGDIVVMKHDQDPKYMSYALSTSDAVKQKGKGKVKSKVVHTSVPSLQEIVVPIPSLEEQKKIANTLDKFHTLVNDLSQGLPAEIEARQQQYEYYRDQLLTFKRKN